MGDALNSGVSGLMAHQKMLDISGNNLSNMNTNGYKSSRVNFSDLLSESIRDASQPTDTLGGTNPLQVGSGVQVASIDRNMSQGTMNNTGQPLDMAIEGSGFFVLNDGQADVFTRVGAFSIDADYTLVDPSTGYRVQRTGSTGVAEGFQDAGSSAIRIPYDTALPATPTAEVTYTGNLSGDQIDPTTNKMTTGVSYLASNGNIISGTDSIFDSSMVSGAGPAGSVGGTIGTISVTGSKADGTAVAFNVNIEDVDPPVTGDGVYSFDDLATRIQNEYQDGGGNDTVNVSIVNGEIRITDIESGYSLTDIQMTYADAAGGTATTGDLPSYFQILEAGGEAVKKTNIEIYDTQGVPHVLSGTFVKTDTPNTWDFVMTSVTGDVAGVSDRRVSGISFNQDGSYAGIAGSGTPQIKVQLNGGLPDMEPLLDFGTVGEFNGLSQFGGSSTAAPTDQDGFEAGYLSSLSVSNDGTLVGVFTNGIRKDLATLEVATFQNPAGLKSIGNNYFESTANSGDPSRGPALTGGAGSVRGGTLESSNVVVATEFVNLIQAQNGYQANARTIRVANDMLQELTNLIR
ncbi:MAG: flagellar hook-basal body complex protein [Phycisphaerae bacterium]